MDTRENPREAREGARLLRIDDVAEQLAVSKSTVYRLLAKGLLPRRRILGATRFTHDDVDELVASARRQ